MGDAARPSHDAFNRVLQDSLDTWASYLKAGTKAHQLPPRAIDLQSLVYQTPPFLGGDSTSESDEKISFDCEDEYSPQGRGNLVVNGRSTWRTSGGFCGLQPRVLSKQLLLAGDSRVSVELSENAPFSNWPGVQGLSGYDDGNYLVVLYLAWAYILSARWIELLDRSVDHECQMSYTVHAHRDVDGSPQPNKQSMIQIDIGDDACEEEIIWWRSVLCHGWNAITRYNGHEYLSPWSVSAKDASLTLTTKKFLGAKSHSVASVTALRYLTRFCGYHRLYAQCSVSLAGALYIPFLGGRTVFLPFPKQVPRPGVTRSSTAFIPKLLNQHSRLLPKYMTLSSNIWGLRSILHSTFFNINIDCNLVSAWLNPAFAIINSISSKEDLLATVLTIRQPQLGILWLGAIFADLAKSILRDIRVGMTPLDLPASAWVGTPQTFLTSKIGTSNGQSISRADECRLLFITASEGHHRPPVWTWKPFGSTKIFDTELFVRNHAQCAAHCLEYDSWEWILTNNTSIKHLGGKPIPHDQALWSSQNPTPTALDNYEYDFSSESLSEGATRGIFGWLRSTGYPSSERPIYQHSWIDLEDTDDEEEPDDAESDVKMQRNSNEVHVEHWLESIE